MRVFDTPPTGNERFFDKDELIVSKTDPKGLITYANDVFIRIADYSEAELLGEPHNILRHPAMPQCVFKLLWDTVAAGNEIFAYVVNRAKNGDHYWVNAHITPWFDQSGRIDGYHSNRRVPDRDLIHGTIEPIYAALLAEERKHATPREAMAASTAMLVDMIAGQGFGDYDSFIHSLDR